MAQASRPQSPWPPVQNQGQSADSFVPPAKRQRLSPNPGSPYSNASNLPYAEPPNMANFAIPNGAFNNNRPNVMPQQSPVSTPGVAAGMMGPPQRPAEKAAEKAGEGKERGVDINELNDLVASSGVNLRDEEELLNASYRTGRMPGTTQGGSAASSFDLLGRNSFGNLGSARSSFAGPQPAMTEEEELVAKHKNAARILAESNQHPLQNPFFWGASIRKHMQSAANEFGLQIPITGLWDRISDSPQGMSGSSMKDANGHGIQVIRAPSMLTRSAPLDPMISLLSLAGNERIRDLLEDAYGIARGRQAGSDGVVPPEWADIATGEKADQTLVNPQSISGTAWDAVPNDGQSQTDAPLKRKKPESVPTTSFSQSRVNMALMSLSQKDRADEEARLKQREARKKKKSQQAALAAASTPIDGSAPGTPGKLPPGMLGEKAPEPKVNKKDRDKAAKQGISEEVAAREANATASMAIGGKQYSWMQAAKKPGMLAKPVIAKPGIGSTAGAKQTKDGLENIKDRKFGSWREDGVGARGVQLRDVINVLELDGREKRTLYKAYMKLDGSLVVPVSAPASTVNTPAPLQVPTPSPGQPMGQAQNPYPPPAQAQAHHYPSQSQIRTPTQPSPRPQYQPQPQSQTPTQSHPQQQKMQPQAQPQPQMQRQSQSPAQGVSQNQNQMQMQR